MARTQSVLALGVLLCSSLVSAATITQIQEHGSYSLDQLSQGSGIVINDKLFYNFSWTCSGEPNIYPPGKGITVTAVTVKTSLGSMFGLRFNAPWTTGANQMVDTTIRFNVKSQSGQLLHDNLLMMTAFATRDSGQIAITENVYAVTDGGINMIPVADLYTFKNQSYFYNCDYTQFQSVLSEIYVIKDIALSGGTAATGSASLSEFYNVYSLPEPASIGMLSAGAIMLLRRRRRTSQS